MIRVKQYPHYLFVTESGESRQDESGNWVVTPHALRLHGPCREETDGRGQEIETAGGVFRRFTSLIQLPRGTQRVADGTHVVIANDAAGSEVRIRGEALKFDAGQLHARLWI